MGVPFGPSSTTLPFPVIHASPLASMATLPGLARPLPEYEIPTEKSFGAEPSVGWKGTLPVMELNSPDMKVVFPLGSPAG
jgi:hypothetical protein